MSADNRNPTQILAIDGGQSSTLALLAERDGTIVSSGRGGPSNHYTEPGGPERLYSALHDSSRAALDAVGRSAADVSHVCLGLTGSFDPARVVAESLFPGARIQSLHDVITALAGASVARSGVVVIAGTGSIAYGRLDDGRETRASGWGYLIGDEGSGYWIGLEALHAAYKAWDGRGAATSLLDRIPEHLRVADLAELHRKVYAHDIGRAEIAGLAAVVTGAARAGDAVAAALLDRAGVELGEAALAVIDRLGQRETGLEVYYTGGVFNAGRLLIDGLERAVVGGSPNSSVHGPKYSPVVGALFLALKDAGVSLDDAVIERVSATLPADAVLKRVERT